VELQLFLDILRRRILTILLVSVLTVLVVVVAGLIVKPTYQAGTTVRVIQDVGVVDLNIKETYGERLMNTYGAILTSWPVLEQAAEELESSLPPAQLRKKVEISVIPDTELMRINAQDTDPAFARDLANSLAGLLVEQAQSMYAGSSRSALEIVEEQLVSIEADLVESRRTLDTLVAEKAATAEIEALNNQIQIKEAAYDRLLDRYELARLNESLRANSITVIEPAQTPRFPSNRIGINEIGIALVVGICGGIGLALVQENLDTRIHSPLQFERLTQLPVLGTVPRGSLSPDSLEQRYGPGDSEPLTEAYRLLGINLEALGEETSLRNILITSALTRDDKSTVTVNLAQTLAERGQTVFLVESDLRHHSATKILDIVDHGPGLSTLLDLNPSLSTELVNEVTQRTEQPSLFFIRGGPEVTNPTALLASPVMEEFLGYLGKQGHTTLLDAPPVLGVADVSVLANKVDGVVLVVGQSRDKREELLAALKQLQARRAHVIGAIFLERRARRWV
jgi:capsular exopolysaccharide synthesis family protein